MNRIILALAALVGQATAFAPAVAPRPATQLQASKFDAGAKAAASLAASLALAGAVLTPEAAFAATATQAGGVCAAAPDSEVCRQSTQVKAKAAATAPVKKAAPAKASKPAAKKSSSKPKASKPKAVKKTKKAKKVRVAPRSPRSLCTLRRRLKRKCKRKKRYGYGAVLRSRFGHRPLALRFERSASGLARPSSSITNFGGHGRARARLTVEREGSRHALLTR